MLNLIFLFFIKINSFSVAENYWSLNSEPMIYICGDDIPANLDPALKNDEFNVYEYFTALNYETVTMNSNTPILPLWALYVIHAFENWSRASGGGINFIYYYTNQFCECKKDALNNICWSSSVLIGDALTKLNVVEDVQGYLETTDIMLNSVLGNSELNKDKYCDGLGDNCYDFLSVMNHAVGSFIGFLELEKPKTVMSSVSSNDISFKTLLEDDINAAQCLYPSTGAAFTKDPECCSSSNPFLRPSTCSNRGFTDNGKYFIGSEPGAGGGCAYIKDSNSTNHYYYFLTYLFIIFSFFIFRSLFKKYLIILFLFYSFNSYSAFEDDLGLDDYDYKALEQNMQNTNVEKKEYMSTKEIVDKEKASKDAKKNLEEKEEAQKVEGLVKNLDTQIKFKSFREKSPYFTGLSFGASYSTVSDFKKLNSNFKEAGILGLKGFPYTYSILIEFGLENIFINNLIFFLSTGYIFNPPDTGVGNIDYGGVSTQATRINNSFSAIPVKFGTRYNFISNSRIRSGLGLSGGLLVSSASVSMISENINSKLELSSIGYTGNLGTYLDWVLMKNLFFVVNLSYEYSKCPNVNIDSSNGWFAVHYPKDSRLLLIEDGKSRPFNFLISGVNFNIGFKGIF